MTTTETRPTPGQAGPSVDELANLMVKADPDSARALWRRVRQEIGRKEQADTRWKHALALLPELAPGRAPKIADLVNSAREKEIEASRGGRPKVDPSADGRSRQEKVVYARGQHEIIRRLASELGISDAQIVRELIDEALVARGLRTKADLAETLGLRR